MSCAAFEAALESHGPTALPAEAAAHPVACPRCAEALAAHRTLARVLPAMGPRPRDEAFFGRQKQSILQRIWQAAQAPVRAVWHAPAGSLAMLLGVIASYVFVGVLGLGEVFQGSALEAVPGAADPLRMLDLVYLALVLLAVRSVWADRAAARPEQA